MNTQKNKLSGEFDARKLIENKFAALFETGREYVNPGVRVGESAFLKEQNGLLAKKNIAQGSVILIQKSIPGSLRSKYTIQVSEELHVKPGFFGKFINHSCDPDTAVFFRLSKDKSHATIMVITLRDIQRGEEITYDYSTTEEYLSEETTDTPCLCASEKCRNKITGFCDLPENEKERLGSSGLLSAYIADHYIEHF